MKLSKLLNKLGFKEDLLFDHVVSDITIDSREVSTNGIFIAISGAKTDGHNFIDEAIIHGAKTIFYEKKIVKRFPGINYIEVISTKKILGQILKINYNKVLNKMRIIGVIGTNGKTTVSTTISSFLNYKKIKNLLIGSNGIDSDQELFISTNTTPDILKIYKHIYRAYKKGIYYVVIEVSSIGISELRIRGIDFYRLIFTNFSEDHLDYHKTMDNYFHYKCIPFFKLNSKNSIAILNADDKRFEEIYKHIESRCITYGIINTKADFFGRDIIIDNDFMKFRVSNYVMKTHLLGKFNVYNLLSCMALFKSLGFNLWDFALFLSDFKMVNGRMNIYKTKDFTTIIDYAHTPDALINVFETIITICKGSITTVIGCGGNREKEKRSIIGQILTKYSDNIILTNDNPRDEEPEKIVEDISRGIDKEYKIILDRSDAIKNALDNSKENDFVLILGKGAEDTQIIGDKCIHFNDAEVVVSWIENNV